MFAAVLDTCVMYSGLQRDFLLSMAAVGIFRVVITDDQLFEIEYVEERKLLRSGADQMGAKAKAAKLVSTLRGAFEIEDPGRVSLIQPVGLPDSGDEHVVAAAIVSGADVIVTENLKDFPADCLPDGLRVQPSHDFVRDMVSTSPLGAATALREMARRRRQPPQSENDLVDLMVLKSQIKGDVADILRRAITYGPAP